MALGEKWSRSAVLVVTEFGRIVKVNGSRGSDHGTGGASFLRRGAIRPRPGGVSWQPGGFSAGARHSDPGNGLIFIRKSTADR